MEHIIYDYSQGVCRGCGIPKTEVTGPEHWRELNERCDRCGARMEREKLVELLQAKYDHYCDQCGVNKDSGYTKNLADYLIAHGVTVRQWISVDDRLPEESGMYIVTAKDGHARRVSFVLWQKRNRTWNLTGARSYWRITHWMPLPQPAKGEGE